MTTKHSNSLVESEPGAPSATNVSFSRRNLLIASATAAAAPAIGTAALQPVAAQAQTPAIPQRFGYPPNREGLNAARAMALESLLIEKGIITDKSVDGVLSFF